MHQFHNKVFFHTEHKRFMRACYCESVSLYSLDYIDQPFMGPDTGFRSYPQITLMIKFGKLKEVNEETVKIIF